MPQQTKIHSIVVSLLLLLVGGCGDDMSGWPREPVATCIGEELGDWARHFWRDEKLAGAFALRLDDCGRPTAAELVLATPVDAAKEMFLQRTAEQDAIGHGIGVRARFRLLEGQAQVGVSIGKRVAQIDRKDGVYEALLPEADAQTLDVRLWLYADGGQTARVIVDQVRVTIVQWGAK